MKKIYTLAAALMVAGSFASKAQTDTLLYESFNFQTFYDDSLVDGLPPDVTMDPMWYNYDEDGLPDGSGAGREGGWFPVLPFANSDTTDNVAMGSSSWTNQGEMGLPTSNWLITRNVTLGANCTLSWKSAPRQTPLYLDGYDVRISNTTNSDLSFPASSIVFNAAEYTGNPGPNDSIFAGYTFAPSGAFVHGLDGTFIEYEGDSARFRGKLITHMVDLSSRAGQNIFVAFHHNSHDDNLISIDDVLITGEFPNSINEAGMNINLSVYPNPATEDVNVNYTLANATNVTITVYDIAGKLVMNQTKDVQAQGFHTTRLATADLNSGFYTIVVSTNEGRSTTKLIVK